MGKYIDEDRALFVINELRGPTRSPAQNELIKRAIIGIELLPAADVAPVKHGRWVQVRIIRYNGDKPYTQFSHNCSLCNYFNKKKKGWNTKFCPNCGAKMDGGSTHE